MSGSHKPQVPKPKPPSGEGDPSDGDGCDIAIDLDLEGVRTDGLQGLSVGDRLSVEREPIGTYESIVCVRADGMKVGAIGNFPKHTMLLSCLRRGVRYIVAVTELQSGRCHVLGGRADR